MVNSIRRRVISLPPGLNHITSRISEPRIRRPWKNFGRRKTGCSRAEADQFPREIKERFLFVVEVPIEPTDLVILAISVVVPLLRAGPFVASGQHRDALGKEEGGEEISPLLRDAVA